MARLNEPPAAPAAPPPSSSSAAPAAESVDALKRRFIRQNRELAKNNSTQSLRIRTLELDVSRLLAENLELRNRVLHLQNEVCVAHTAASTAAVRCVKEELRGKIAELSGLVEGIEDAAQPREDLEGEKKKVEGNWRERQPLSEVMRESLMPTIVEDKQYPRRTLNAAEIQAIRLSDHSSNESPDLGPPPVATFDYEDLVKSAASPLVNKHVPSAAPTATGEEDVLPADFSVNLETRRKRKEGAPRLEIKRHSILPASPGKGAEGETSSSSSILRTGAKRKLADRESEKPIPPPSKGDFTFSRKASSDEAKANKESEEGRETMKAKDVSHAASSPKPGRKVLGEKSVNMSPRKARSKGEKEENEALVKLPPVDTNKEPTSTRKRRISSIPLPTAQDETNNIHSPTAIAPASTSILPKTPTDPSDLFSPPPSTAPDATAGRDDTPPPSDLSTLSNTTDGGSLRPSRRARAAAVNYAEPSLIAKMRRPDKKLVDAVGDGRKRSDGGMKIKQEPATEEEEEEERERAWRGLPPAPLASAGAVSSAEDDFPPPSAAAGSPSLVEKRPSASSATISALVAASRTRRESTRLAPVPPSAAASDIDIDAPAKRKEELELYEFKDSSSPLTDEAVPAASARVRASQSRRHSSVLKDVARVEERSGGGAGLVEREREKGGGRGLGRRRSMQV